MGGQVLLEQLFKFNTVLSIVVEFLGGIVFIVLLMRKGTP
jgi:iron complex transport system permease protein